MDSRTVAHRWANKDFGKNGTLKASRSCRCEGRNYFSYSTVFGQWLDMEKNVVAIFDGSTSNTSSKYKLHRGYFPSDVHVFPLDFGHNSYYGWRNCNLVSSYNFKDEDFKFYHRMQMISHYVDRIYGQLKVIDGGKSKGLENVDFSAWEYIEELCSLYKDTSIAKYLKWSAPKKDMNKTQKADINNRRKLVRMLKDGERNVETLTDALFGEGTYKAYYDYCGRYRKSSDKRAKVESLCRRLGIASPYESSWRYGRLDSKLTADQIRNLTAKERNDLHFASIMRKESRKMESAVKEKYNKNFRNAYKWIVGFEPEKKNWGGGYESGVKNNCVNKDNGVVYECSGEYIYRFYWVDKSVTFDYDSFCMSEDKEQWIANFYAKCKEVALNRKAILTLQRIKAHTKEKVHSYDDDVFINDDYLRENTTEAEYAICAEFIRKQDKHFADEEARRRAAEIARIKREEEERKEKEYQKKVKQEQIQKCVASGDEGCRNLWRLHYTSITEASMKYVEIQEDIIPEKNFYFGGNVLLRFSMNKDKIESSKNIRMTIATAKAMWKIVSKWHENPASFKRMNIKTLSGTYTIVSYKNDILTAGCHDIAYAEMEHMYNEIVKLENEAA